MINNFNIIIIEKKRNKNKVYYYIEAINNSWKSRHLVAKKYFYDKKSNILNITLFRQLPLLIEIPKEFIIKK